MSKYTVHMRSKVYCLIILFMVHSGMDAKMKRFSNNLFLLTLYCLNSFFRSLSGHSLR